MDKLSVFVGSALAGQLIEEARQFQFRYEPDYQGPSIFIGLPLHTREKVWTEFPPPFDGLLPEGVLLEQLLVKHKLDRNDKWGQLVAVGQDLTGFLSVIPSESAIRPFGKIQPGHKFSRRARIHPGEDALPYTVNELVSYHSTRKLRMSLSGVQPKVSSIYSRQRQQFLIVDQNGSYILKPSPQAFPGAAENETCTMLLARDAGLQVPPCGYLQTKDGAGVFWIERFDRWGQGNRHRIRCEDACQILELPSSWKYTGNLESLARMVSEYCSNPKLQLVRLFQRVLFCWISGNGDMHLKNWSLVESGPLIEFSPAYDLLNTVILTNDEEESALALDDRKSGFDQLLLVNYFGRDICQVNARMIDRVIAQLTAVNWKERIASSAMSAESKQRYQELVASRINVLARSQP